MSISYRVKEGYILSPTEEEVAKKQAELFHSFTVRGKEKPLLETVFTKEHKQYGTLFTHKGISVLVTDEMLDRFLNALEIKRTCSRLDAVLDDFDSFFTLSASEEEGFGVDEFLLIEYKPSPWGAISSAFVVEVVDKYYNPERPFVYEFYHICNSETLGYACSMLFKESTLAPEVDEFEEGICKGMNFSPSSKGKKVAEKVVKTESKLEEMKLLGILPADSVDFQNPEHLLLYQKICSLENLLKSLSVESLSTVIKDTIKSELEGYIVTRNIKTYCGSGENAPAKKRKLSADKICEMYISKVPMKLIVEQAGISKQAIYNILKKEGIK